MADYTASKQTDNWSVDGEVEKEADLNHSTKAGITSGRSGQLETTFGGPETFQDPDNRNADRAIAVDDIPQMFNLAATYELPVGTGKAVLNRTGILGKILGGWKLSGNFTCKEGLRVAISAPGAKRE